MSSDLRLEEKVLLKCPFYDKCGLSKPEYLCEKFPDYLICPEYELRKARILKT